MITLLTDLALLLAVPAYLIALAAVGARHEHPPPPRLAPGTRVTVVIDGRVCAGVVAHYEPNCHPTRQAATPIKPTRSGEESGGESPRLV